MQGGPLDHVALWTDARDELAEFLCDRAGMHVIDKTDTFTLVGVVREFPTAPGSTRRQKIATHAIPAVWI